MKVPKVTELQISSFIRSQSSDDIQYIPRSCFVACAISIPSFTLLRAICHSISTISISLIFFQPEVQAFEKLGLIARCGVSTGRAYCGVCGSAERHSAFTLGEAV